MGAMNSMAALANMRQPMPMQGQPMMGQVPQNAFAGRFGQMPVSNAMPVRGTMMPQMQPPMARGTAMPVTPQLQPGMSPNVPMQAPMAQNAMQQRMMQRY